jgi:peptidoglycan/xylan/chitin deacetylase (PgdA/CDA1 family)
LLYHHFPPECRSGLNAQCAFLQERYTPIALPEAIGCLQRQERLPRNAIAVTVDDGYADYLQFARDCFLAYGIPTTVFVTEKFIDGAHWLWFDRIEHAIRVSKRSEIQISAGEWGGPIRTRMDAETERAAAAKTLIKYAKELASPEVEPFVVAIERAAEVNLPLHPTGEYAGMNWDDLKELSASGTVTIGAHTATHPILSRLAGSAELTDEIAGCRKRIENKLGMPVSLFAYPNGRPSDIDAEVVSAVKEAGYQAAFTTTPGVNRRRVNLLIMKRIAMRPEFPVSYLADALAAAR